MNHHFKVNEVISRYNFDRISKIRGNDLEKIFYLSSFRLNADPSAYSIYSSKYGNVLVEDILAAVNEALAQGHAPMNHFSALMAVWYTSPNFNLEFSELEREFKRQRLIDGYEGLFDLTGRFGFGALYDALYSIYKNVKSIRAPEKEKRWNNTNKSFYKKNQVSYSIKKNDETFEAGWCAYYNLKLLARSREQIKMYAAQKGFSSLLKFITAVPDYERFTLNASPDIYCTEYFDKFAILFENLELILSELFCFLYERNFGTGEPEGGIKGNDVPIFDYNYYVDSLAKEGAQRNMFLIFEYDDFSGLLEKFSEHYLNVAA